MSFSSGAASKGPPSTPCAALLTIEGDADADELDAAIVDAEGGDPLGVVVRGACQHGGAVLARLAG